MARNFAEIAFTERVKAIQEKMGSRRSYAKVEARTESNRLGEAEAEFITELDHFFLATVSATGYPYIQHRGGPRGFLKVLDDRTLGFADFRGNLQYISLGNLSGNDCACLFLIDYKTRTRLKIYARIEIVDLESSPEVLGLLSDPGYPGVVERGMLIHVESYDWNCPQHITPRYTIEEIEEISLPLRQRLAELEAEVKKLKGRDNV